MIVVVDRCFEEDSKRIMDLPHIPSESIVV